MSLRPVPILAAATVLIAACAPAPAPPAATSSRTTIQAPPASAPPHGPVVQPVTAAELGTTWRPGCPVPPEQLRRVELDYVGFDNQIHRGALVVNEALVADVIAIFGDLQRQRYPIERMQTVDRYPGAEDPVLCDVNLTIRPGQTTAVVGSTGAGKTTLVNLIPRLYDVTGGQVLVDGVDVREFAQEDLWSYLGLVPQKSFLFSGTVGSNVRFGLPDATDEQVWDALDVAQADRRLGEVSAGGAGDEAVPEQAYGFFHGVSDP